MASTNTYDSSSPTIDPEKDQTTQNQRHSSHPSHDIKLTPQASIANSPQVPESAFKGLGWLDRFLAVWIFLSMAIGIILGNFVPNTGPALQKGKFVGVSVPIGKTGIHFELPS